jgi:hypothetical protein
LIPLQYWLLTLNYSGNPGLKRRILQGCKPETPGPVLGLSAEQTASLLALSSSESRAGVLRRIVGSLRPSHLFPLVAWVAFVWLAAQRCLRSRSELARAVIDSLPIACNCCPAPPPDDFCGS